MMRYIIFGAGGSGHKALHFLGYHRVYAFASNDPLDGEGRERTIEGKPVISFDEMLELSRAGDHMIVIATERYAIALDAQVRAAGISKYFVFHEGDIDGIGAVYPGYFLNGKWVAYDYNRILSLYQIGKYKRIAVCGANWFLPYLISEISYQNDYHNIVGVVPGAGGRDVQTAGVPVRALEDVWDEIDCLVVDAKRCDTPAHDILFEREHAFDVVDLYDIDRFEPAFRHPELAKFKDIHKGKRIFLVGNGPSLRIEDLETLHEHGEICFGFNQIWKIFGKTSWRPDYLGIVDQDSIPELWEGQPDYTGRLILADRFHTLCLNYPFDNYYNVDYVHYQHEDLNDYFPNMPAFSSDVTIGVYYGRTVTYSLGMQFSAYMGASEIYLLGVDHSYAKGGIDQSDHFISNYWSYEREQNIQKQEITNIETMTKAYEKAEAYSRKHGFRIFNATRGGNLEVFERVNFDSLFDR